jgi:ketosteroid isomerase-like protein
VCWRSEQGRGETFKVLKLADAKEEAGAKLEHANERLVRLLYAALASGDAAKVAEVVDEDLEWWFYGPRREQHMMRLLTGVTSCDTFAFDLTSSRAIGNRVFVEGEAPSSSSNSARVFWVHIWTIKDKRITQLREYFNTAILVTDLQPTAPTPHEIQHHPCAPLWQNHLWKSKEGRELPGLILAI